MAVAGVGCPLLLGCAAYRGTLGALAHTGHAARRGMVRAVALLVDGGGDVDGEVEDLPVAARL